MGMLIMKVHEIAICVGMVDNQKIAFTSFMRTISKTIIPAVISLEPSAFWRTPALITGIWTV